jgi:hypothetical protein
LRLRRAKKRLPNVLVRLSSLTVRLENPTYEIIWLESQIYDPFWQPRQIEGWGY